MMYEWTCSFGCWVKDLQDRRFNGFCVQESILKQEVDCLVGRNALFKGKEELELLVGQDILVFCDDVGFAVILDPLTFAKLLDECLVVLLILIDLAQGRVLLRGL